MYKPSITIIEQHGPSIDSLREILEYVSNSYGDVGERIRIEKILESMIAPRG
jgi:hypothetical protein